MKKKDKRFATVLKESGDFIEKAILVDRETGVTYLYASSGYGGGITPLLDRDGKPVINSVSDLESEE